MSEAGVSITVCLPPAVLSQLRVEVLTTALASVFALFAAADAQAGHHAPIGAAPKPAAPRRAPPGANPNHWATAAVKETLVRMYPCSDPFYDTEAIREAMRACGGPPLPAWSTIGVYAIQTLHLRRGKAPARPPRVARARERSGRPGLRAVEPIAPLRGAHGCARHRAAASGCAMGPDPNRSAPAGL
jgi:hypothetical protein